MGNQVSSSKQTETKRKDLKTCNNACYYVMAGYCCCVALSIIIVFVLWMFNYAAIVKAVALAPS